MVKIIHCADVHFDSPFALNDPRNAELRRTEFRSAFTSLVMYAKNYGAKIFLIAGDLFDDEYISKDTANLISREIASYPDCRFFVSPGDSDPYHIKSPYKQMKWPENVHIFKSNDLMKIEIPELNTDVYGYAFTADNLQVNPFSNKKPQNQDRINILVGHGDMSASDSQFCPITAADIGRSGFDYIALGHLHDGKGVLKVGGTNFAYPGCLEGRGFHEPGYRGAMYGEIDKGVCELKARRFSKRRYETIEVDISQLVTENQIIEAVRLATANLGDDTALRIELTGILRPGFIFNPHSIEEKFKGFNFIEVKNKTTPYIDANTLRYDKTVKGIFFRKLESRLNSQDIKEREEARLALQYGFNAFIGLNIIDF
ncbi:MAG: metallophosphoesterase [Oscillospiraceae bacterium]|nr:metallophosphoesterase [Oscillospiraceae bacterium]